MGERGETQYTRKKCLTQILLFDGFPARGGKGGREEDIPMAVFSPHFSPLAFDIKDKKRKKKQVTDYR